MNNNMQIIIFKFTSLSDLEWVCHGHKNNKCNKIIVNIKLKYSSLYVNGIFLAKEISPATLRYIALYCVTLCYVTYILLRHVTLRYATLPHI